MATETKRMSKWVWEELRLTISCRKNRDEQGRKQEIPQNLGRHCSCLTERRERERLRNEEKVRLKRRRDLCFTQRQRPLNRLSEWQPITTNWQKASSRPKPNRSAAAMKSTLPNDTNSLKIKDKPFCFVNNTFTCVGSWGLVGGCSIISQTKLSHTS